MLKVKKAVMLLCLVYVILFLRNAFFLHSYNWYGFGVDSSGRVYIGEKDLITVLENNQMVHTIEIPPHRSYYFTVQTDDTILLVNESYVYVIDYYGNILSREKDKNSATYIKLMGLQEVVTANGDTYRCRMTLGRERIEDEYGGVIYEVPFGAYFSKIAYPLPFVLVAIIVFFSEWEKIEKQQKSKY